MLPTACLSTGNRYVPTGSTLNVVSWLDASSTVGAEGTSDWRWAPREAATLLTVGACLVVCVASTAALATSMSPTVVAAANRVSQTARLLTTGEQSAIRG